MNLRRVFIALTTGLANQLFYQIDSGIADRDKDEQENIGWFTTWKHMSLSAKICAKCSKNYWKSFQAPQGIAYGIP